MLFDLIKFNFCTIENDLSAVLHYLYSNPNARIWADNSWPIVCLSTFLFGREVKTKKMVAAAVNFGFVLFFNRRILRIHNSRKQMLCNQETKTTIDRILN